MHLTPAEDFQKILSDWQEHLGAMQASDSDDLDVCCGQPFPDTIFDSDISLSAPPSASSCSSSNSRSLLKPRQERLATAGGNVYGMKAESQDARLPIMADDSDEEDQLKPILDIKIEFDDEDCVDVETVADQMPGSEFISLSIVYVTFIPSNCGKKLVSKIELPSLQPKYTLAVKIRRLQSSKCV